MLRRRTLLSSGSYTIDNAPDGVYAMYSDGSLRTVEKADTDAIGVALLTDRCRYLIGKDTIRDERWDPDYRTNYRVGANWGLWNYDDPAYDYYNFNGEESTISAATKITAYYSIIRSIRSCTVTIRGTTLIAFLGTEREVMEINKYITEVNAIMYIITGDYFTRTDNRSHLLVYSDCWTVSEGWAKAPGNSYETSGYGAYVGRFGDTSEYMNMHEELKVANWGRLAVPLYNLNNLIT